ncbi:hypothetical protein BDAP_001007 [Binucleata daphniae]
MFFVVAYKCRDFGNRSNDELIIENQQNEQEIDNLKHYTCNQGYEKTEANTSDTFKANIDEQVDAYQGKYGKNEIHDKPYFSFRMPIGFCHYTNTIIPLVIGNTIISSYKLKHPDIAKFNANNKEFITVRVYNYSTVFILSPNNDTFAEVVSCFLDYLLIFCEDDKFYKETVKNYKKFKKYNYIINKYTILKAIQKVKDEKEINIELNMTYNEDEITKDIVYLYFSHFRKILITNEENKVVVNKVSHFNENLAVAQNNYYNELRTIESKLRNKVDSKFTKFIDSAMDTIRGKIKILSKLYYDDRLSQIQKHNLKDGRLCIIENCSSKRRLEVIIDIEKRMLKNNRKTINNMMNTILHGQNECLNEMLKKSNFAINCYYEICDYTNNTYRLTLFINLTLEGLLHYPHILRLIQIAIENYIIAKRLVTENSNGEDQIKSLKCNNTNTGESIINKIVKSIKHHTPDLVKNSLIGSICDFIHSKTVESLKIINEHADKMSSYLETQTVKNNTMKNNTMKNDTMKNDTMKNDNDESLLETLNNTNEWRIFIHRNLNKELLKELSENKVHLACVYCKNEYGCNMQKRENYLFAKNCNATIKLFDGCNAYPVMASFDDLMEIKYEKIISDHYIDYKYIYETNDNVDNIDVILNVNFDANNVKEYMLISKVIANMHFYDALAKEIVNCDLITFKSVLGYNTLHFMVTTPNEHSLKVFDILINTVNELYQIDMNFADYRKYINNIMSLDTEILSDDVHDVFERFVRNKIPQKPEFRNVYSEIDYTNFVFNCTKLKILVKSQTVSYKYEDICLQKKILKMHLRKCQDHKHSKVKDAFNTDWFDIEKSYIGEYFFYKNFDLKTLIILNLYMDQFDDFLQDVLYEGLDDITNGFHFKIVSNNFSFGYQYYCDSNISFSNLKKYAKETHKKFKTHMNQKDDDFFVSLYKEMDFDDENKWNMFKEKYNINEAMLFYNDINCLDYLNKCYLSFEKIPRKVYDEFSKKVIIENEYFENTRTSKSKMKVERKIF